MQQLISLARLYEVLRIGSELCEEANITAYAHLLIVTDTVDSSTLGVGGWMNPALAHSSNKINTSRSPMVAAWKVAELVAYYSHCKLDVLSTPTGMDGGCGWAGGEMNRFNSHLFGVAVSAWNQNIDRGWAGFLLHLIPEPHVIPSLISADKGLVHISVQGDHRYRFITGLSHQLWKEDRVQKVSSKYMLEIHADKSNADPHTLTVSCS